MPARPEDLVIYLSILSEEKDLHVMVPQNLKSGFITGGSAAVGGFCGGPVGLLVGGAFGGTVAALSCKDKCVVVKDLLVALNYDKRVEIFDALHDVLENVIQRSRNYTELSATIEKDLDLKHAVLRSFKDFITLKWGFKFYDPRSKGNSSS